ncbi:tRNA (guanosine(46)-N7)-methyltransferase TrmB [candidate division KSB1 bacterium]|nr:tRNA (guanosine(46)-N7)-methyltransferase TrmB [candidate division KSB1 bacterium]
MSRSKLERFTELETFANTFQIQSHLKGRWHQDYFRNNNPITLELGCGKGEYSLTLAKMFPARNFIGVDIKGARLWNGAKKALEDKLSNVAFLRMRIEDIDREFASGEISTIWIPFPDPYPKHSKANKRMTCPRFLHLYSRILHDGGKIHLKTDDDNLYRYTLDTLRRNNHPILDNYTDLHHVSVPEPEWLVQTTFEKKQALAGHSIKYISFKLNHQQD